MPRFEPFRGLRYEEGALRGLGESLDDVIAPPYDVIGPEERDHLVRRSSHNSVLVELPADDPPRERYEVARALLGEWREDGLLLEDPEPAFYGYRMAYTEAGQARATVGVIGALGAADVLPHERTMPKPKGDRLDLLRATQANLSPIWGLSLASGLSGALQAPRAGEATARDLDGVTHEMWRISEPSATQRISALVASEPVVLADGHHRFETALAYGEEQRAAGAGPGDHDLVMALVVELVEEQLTVRAIHRAVAGLPGGTDILGEVGRAFHLSEVPREARGPEQPAGGIVMLTGGRAWVLQAREATTSAAGMDLDSSRLDVSLRDLPPHTVSYEPDPTTVARSVDSGAADVGFLLRPASVEAISETARTGARMPPKTTFFQPKPRTGMVFRCLRS